jgi:hypothetical protein
MNHLQVGDFQYLLLPGKCPPNASFSSLYNDVYDIWKSTWVDLFKQSGALDELMADDFRRADIITVITYKGKVAACHFYSFFDIRQPVVRDLTYFTHFPQTAVDKLLERGADYCMSMEYLTVHPDCRKSKIGVSLASVLLSIGLKTMTEHGGIAAIGSARTEVGVSDITYQLGAICLEKGIIRANYPCDLVAIVKDDIKVIPDLPMQRLIKHLWETRTDLLVPQKTETQRKAG